MTVPQAFLALAILCLLLGGCFAVFENVKRHARREASGWRREWPVAQSRPFDRERDAA